MEIQINSTKEFSDRLQTLARAVNKSNALPILSGVLMRVDNGLLSMTTGDGEVFLSTSLEVSGEDVPPTCVDITMLSNSVKLLAEQPLHVIMEEEQMKIVTAGGEYVLPVVSGLEYPATPDVSGTVMTFNASRLSKAFDYASFAVAQNTVRLALSCVYLDFRQDSTRVVASDGHVLVRVRMSDVVAPSPFGVLLPMKAVSLLTKVTSGLDEDAVLTYDGKGFSVSAGQYMLTARGMEGKYPNYDAIIPRESTCTVEVNRQQLLGTVRRVLPFASESSMLMRMQVSDDKVLLEAEDIDFSRSAHESTSCTVSGSNPPVIGLKGSTVQNILSKMTAPVVHFNMTSQDRPVVFVQDEDDVTMLCMPMLLR